MNGNNSIVQIKDDFNSVKNEWRTAKLNIAALPLSQYSGKFSNIVEVVDSGFSYMEDILKSLEMLLKVISTTSDVWKYILNSAIDILENFLQESSGVHFLSTPPIVLVKSEDRLGTYKPILRRIYPSKNVYSYVNPLTGDIIEWLNAYNGPDLMPYYVMVRDSILDIGDVAAPFFKTDRKFWSATLLFEVGSSIPDLFYYATQFSDIPIARPLSVPNTFRIYADGQQNNSIIRFDSDSIIYKLVKFFAVPGGTSSLDLKYSLYRTEDRSVGWDSIYTGTLSELFVNNWSKIDDTAQKNKGYFYRAFIYDNNNRPILVSNISQVFLDEFRPTTIPSIPPDWSKLSIERLFIGESNISNIFGVARSIINTLNSMIKSFSDNLYDAISLAKGIVSSIRDVLNRIVSLLEVIKNTFLNLINLRQHAIFKDGYGNGYSLIDMYKRILVDSPPDIDKSSSDKIVYMVCLVGDSSNYNVFELVKSMFSTASNSSKEAVKRAVEDLDYKIKEFDKWLESIV
ncbi:MAG: hypothetical protein ABIM30_00250 [candidate division WOR-3 bacterium]